MCQVKGILCRVTDFWIRIGRNFCESIYTYSGEIQVLEIFHNGSFKMKVRVRVSAALRPAGGSLPT